MNMIASPIAIKAFISLLFSWLPLLLFSTTVPISDQELRKPIALKPFLGIIEDEENLFTANELYLKPSIFVPLSQFKAIEPDHSFWLHTNIETSADLNQRHISIVFKHLTFVELYLYKDGEAFIHRQAGAFREKKFLTPGDNRFAFNIILEAGANYTLLLKVKHTKKYNPNLDFVLQNTLTPQPFTYPFDFFNAFLQGALAILAIYAAMLWLINRYRPYLWLLLFMLGIGLYSFAIRPIFIDIFFPNNPETGWLMVLPFLHLGVLGFYLLTIDFLEIKKNAPLLFVYSRFLIKIMIVFFVLCLLNNILTSNYYFSNSINLYFAPIHLCYISYIIIFLKKKLNSAQHYLVYGILLFAIAATFVTINTFLYGEQSLDSSPIIAKSTISCISLLFFVGLHKQLQQHVQDKIIILQQLNDINLQYNTMIEKKVEERTLALKNTNVKLVEQQAQLIEKNRHIEILIDELNHRVKNNLQMLYSLNTLQLPLIEDIKSKQILNEMRGRIKAMMVVNEHLHAFKKDQLVTLANFINEITDHLQQIYDHEKNIKITTVIPEDFQVSAPEALPFGLLLTELFTNTYKHAFTESHIQPQIKLVLFVLDQQLRFIFEDNGQGTHPFTNKNSMGISLIQDLTRQLKGTVTIKYENGFSYQFIFSNVKQYAHINH